MSVCSSSNMEVPGARRVTLTCHLQQKQLLNIQPKKGEELKLFKVNGAVIDIERIDVGGLSKGWTIGNYLSIFTKKSSSQINNGFSTIMESEGSYTSTSSQ